MVRDGEWTRVRPGAYVDTPAGTDRHADARLLALARIASVVGSLTTPLVVSHSSAALLWGLPAPTTSRVHIVQGTTPTGGAADVARHAHALAEDEHALVHGVPVTSATRTVVDCAMSLSPRAGLVVADAAVHAGVDRAACLDLVARMAGRRGVVRARAVLDLADDGAESPGESLARFVLLAAGLPRPTTQVPVETRLGTFWSDLGWPEWCLLAEYDGRSKYEAGGSASEVVVAEKRRQDAIEDAGYRVLRLTKEDVQVPERLVARVVRAAPPGFAPRPLVPRGVLAAWPRRRR